MQFLRSLLVFLFASGAFAIASAQTYEGRILGTVTGQSGALVKGARITFTNVDTGATREILSNEAGTML